MATERVTERDDGVTAERTVERNGGDRVVVERGGGGAGTIVAVIIGLVLVAIVAWFLMNMNQQNAIETDAVTEAAGSVGEAAENVGEAAQRAVPAG
ncbi:hypothetical protein [Brevundimonas sp.]|uniref:hypothetical protein n=1 Tax=Brevundimonas sp. TaxID=1871086 RepID=UPI0025F98B3A|nr:hypothetical protein [Brevundimonas sp.]